MYAVKTLYAMSNSKNNSVDWQLGVINERPDLDNENSIPYLYIWTQAYLNLRKLYIMRTTANKPYIARISLGYVFAADNMGLSSFKFSW